TTTAMTHHRKIATAICLRSAIREGQARKPEARLASAVRTEWDLGQMPLQQIPSPPRQYSTPDRDAIVQRIRSLEIRAVIDRAYSLRPHGSHGLVNPAIIFDVGPAGLT